MSASKNHLPKFDSVDKLVEFCETHDMGEYELPEVKFDVDIDKESLLVPVDLQLMEKVSQLAQSRHISTEKLVNSWLEEKIAQTA